MMDFISFARAHGLEIKSLNSGDKIYRCGTDAHPTSKNGAYLFDGRRGFVQNWERGDDVHWWDDERQTKPWTEQERRQWSEKRMRADAERARAAEDAIRKAAGMIKSASVETHPYITEKGFPELKVLVNEGVLLIPMRSVSGELVGAQTVRLAESRREWEKKMLYGTRAKGAVMCIGPQKASMSVLVEGYATGLSVEAALRLIRLQAKVVICFSAQNLLEVAKVIPGKRVVYADNDRSGTGERVARESGLPWCMSDELGNDANDDHLKFGVMYVAQKIARARA